MKRDKLDVQPVFRNLPAKKKVLYIFIFTIMFISFGIIALQEAYSYYPKTQAGQTQAKEIARDFTVALSGRNYNAAHKLLTPVTQKYINTSESLGSKCENCRPVSGVWSSYDHDKRAISGTIKFEDGVEMPARVKVDWYKGEFRIYAVEFKDEDTKDTRMNFFFTGDDYSYFDWIYWIAPSLR